MLAYQKLPYPEWQAERSAYLDRVRPWAEDRVRRMSRAEKHPIYDFLFEYYSFRPAHLLRWSPGFDLWLENATPKELTWAEFQLIDGGSVLPASQFPPQRHSYLHWAIDYLAAVSSREPSFGCMGLHEWAMVYRDRAIRHSYVPLRLSPEETDAVVESQPLRCTHYDAYRFFTLLAAPKNRHTLTRQTTTDNDQPGCIHVGMDLYKFAYKIAPFCPGRLLADTFDLARAAREIDMRASPYDLSGYGFTSIPIETREGREEYVELQRELCGRGGSIREKVLEVYRGLVGWSEPRP